MDMMPGAPGMEIQRPADPVAEQIATLRSVFRKLPTFRQDFACDLIRQHETGRRALSENQMTWVARLIEMAAEADKPVETPPVLVKLAEVCGKLPSNKQDFANSLLTQFRTRKSLSPAQMDWAGKLIAIAEEEVEPASATFGTLAELFSNAKANGLQAPMLRIRVGKDDLKIKSERDNSISVRMNGQRMGHMNAQGQYFGREEGIAPLAVIAEDPLAAAQASGRETGNCCCCGRELTDPVSVERGIGPICEGKYWR